MTTPIEAQSLASVNHLLANPPQYPRNPTHEIQKPLVLYIVRVPGNKDVFLTPLKPPTKSSISLEAIQSSLYYLHVNTPEDDEIRRSIDSQQPERQENIPLPVARKPLPPIPPAINAGDTQSYPPSSANAQYHPIGNVLTDISNGNQNTAGDAHHTRANTIKRKPVGRPSSQILLADHSSLGLNAEKQGSRTLDLSTPHFHQGQEIRARGSNAQQAAYERPGSYVRGHSETGSFGSLSSARQSPTGPMTPSVVEKSGQAAPIITLIRRDPVSGAQWNIGSLTQSDASTVGSSLKPVTIELATPGYTKFLHQLETRAETFGSTAESIKNAIAVHQQSLSPATQEDLTLKNFTRRVEFRPQQEAVRQFRLQSRASSHDSIPNYPIQNKPPRSIYSFTSPWQGLCTFSNGIDGKSLRCRHTLPSSSPQEEGTSINVAELRFNLAWSLLSPRDTSKQQMSIDTRSEADTLPIAKLLKEPRGGKETWRRSMQHIKTLSRDLKESSLRDRDRRDQSQIEAAYAANAGFNGASGHDSTNSSVNKVNHSHQKDEQNSYRLSLRLGREKAGGGFQGNSAKLGKLIIEDEGLKMGDLVVAACMSVWWQHYAGSVGF